MRLLLLFLLSFSRIFFQQLTLLTTSLFQGDQTPLNFLSTREYHLLCKIWCPLRYPTVRISFHMWLRDRPSHESASIKNVFEAFSIYRALVKPSARSTPKLFYNCFCNLCLNLVGIHAIITPWATIVIKFDVTIRSTNANQAGFYCFTSFEDKNSVQELFRDYIPTRGPKIIQIWQKVNQLAFYKA